MPLGQGWLNAWVKVNNKHVVYNRPEGEQGQFSTAPTKPFKSSRTISSAKTTRTLISDDAESQSIRRVNSRKNRRRLHRTISASDLIRDQARSLAGKAEGGVSLDVSAQSQISAEHTRDSSSLGGLPPLVNNHEQCGDRSAARMETEQSLLFVSGLFGADIDSFARREPPKLGDHFMDKDGVLLQWAPQTQILDSASIQSRGVISLPVHHATPQAHRAEPDDNVSKGGFRFPPNIFSSDNGKSRCGQCTNYENELSALQDDLEYVRSVALRNEYVCTTCNAESSKHPTEVPSALHLTNSTRLLDEVTARHKTQLEQLTKDRVCTSYLSPHLTLMDLHISHS